MKAARWSGNTVVVIGSGPSLTAEDCSTVESSGLPTIAVNSSWKAARFCDVIYGGDMCWWDAYASEIDIDAERWSCTPQAVSKHGLSYHKAWGRYNSGMRAIQFAIAEGASRVILLGFDGNVDSGTHWHGDHTKTGNPDFKKCREWMGQFSMVASEAVNSDVEIINCSRSTSIVAFRTGDLGEELKRKHVPGGVLIKGMHGLGDNIYQRGFVSQMPKPVWIETPWPQLYSDIEGVHAVMPQTKLRTQAKNVRAVAEWDLAPTGLRSVQIHYGYSLLANGSIISAMANQFGVEPLFTLPSVESRMTLTDKPIALIRPVTARREWLNTARNPKPEYVSQAAGILRSRGYHVIAVADIENGKEWIVGDVPEADEYYLEGELNVTDLLYLVQRSSIVVGGIGWIVPASIASGTHLCVIQGGNGASNAPQKITDHRRMALENVKWIGPENMCMCASHQHDCNKEIVDFQGKFNGWLDGLGFSETRNARASLVA
jgi:hypothetical protein